MVNLYLGDIPAGFDYDLYLYRYNSYGVIAYSAKTSGNYEFIQFTVRPGDKYYAKVVSKSSTVSSAYYQLRFKKYEYGGANLYGFNFSDISTVNQISNVATHLENIGYTTWENIDYPASSAYSMLPYGWVYLSSSHANAGFTVFRNNGSDSFLFADYSGTLYDNFEKLSSLSYNALSPKRLVIYAGCYTGATSDSYGNLVEMTLSKGAHACFGSYNSVITADMSNWLSEFFYLCETQNKSVADIIMLTANNLREGYTVYDTSIFNINDGDSCDSVIV